MISEDEIDQDRPYSYREHFHHVNRDRAVKRQHFRNEQEAK